MICSGQVALHSAPNLLNIGMKKLLLLACCGLLLSACSSEKQDPESDETPDAAVPVLPEGERLSTLDEDLEIIFGAETTACYADCFGDYYHTGLYMWGFYFQEYSTKEQLYIEIMHPAFSIVAPTGSYVASSDPAEEAVMLRGVIDEDGYQAYSWYLQIDASGKVVEQAPISGGTFTLRSLEDERYEARFDLQDDGGHRIFGTFTGPLWIEDFR